MPHNRTITIQDIAVPPENTSEKPGCLKQENGSGKKKGTFFPKKSDGVFEIIRKTVLIIAILTMVTCTGILLNMFIIQPIIENIKDNEITNTSISPSELSKIKEEKPDIQTKSAFYYAKNSDYVGWLTISGADISKPIVQVKGERDKSSRYLKTAFDKSKSKYGCLYVSGKNNIKHLDRNTIIFGHNMSYDDLMFGKLESYKEIDGFKAAPLIDFQTLYADYKWKIYAVFITNGELYNKDDHIFNYFFNNLSSNESFESYIEQLNQRKLYSTGVDINPKDKILTLSTCCYDFDDARLVVVARMVRPGENVGVNTSLAVQNKNPRYPQAWYSAKGLSNPYSTDDIWLAN